MTPALLANMLEGSWEFAKHMLGKAGEFYPFAETADTTGKRALQGAYDGQEHPGGKEIYALLQAALLSDVAQGKIAALALTANVDIPPQYKPEFPDGIRVHLEALGYSRFVYLPYRVSRRSVVHRLLRRAHPVAYGEPVSVEIPPLFFRQPTAGGGPTIG